MSDAAVKANGTDPDGPTTGQAPHTVNLNRGKLSLRAGKARDTEILPHGYHARELGTRCRPLSERPPSHDRATWAVVESTEVTVGPIRTRSALGVALATAVALMASVAVVSAQSDDTETTIAGLHVSGITSGDVITTTQLVLAVEPVGYELSAISVGGEPVAGSGHYHVHVDGALNGVYADPEAIVDLRHLASGPHTLTVLPAANDHTEVPEGAAMFDFEYEPGSPDTVRVALREWSLEPSELTLPPGTYTFIAPNEGSVEHSLMITGAGFRAATPDATYAAGISESFTVDLAPGTYEMLCPLPWHKSTGMVGKIIVAS